MCDVLFITPNMNGSLGAEAMGTLQLASILKEKNIECDILTFHKIGDLKDFEKFTQNALNIISELKPKIVSFYTRCDIYHIDLKLAQLIKNKWEDIYIVCGGPQSDITAKQTIENIPFVDFICCGEGENTIYPFFSSLLQGAPDLSVPGLVYRIDGVSYQNPRPVMIENLDDLPMIDYSFLRLENENADKKDTFPIEVGRGCPFGCTFCSTNAFWGRKYRLKSPQRIYEEIKKLNKEYGFKRFGFTHDMFTLNRNKVKETCELLKTLDFKIEWGGSSRIDCLDAELIDIMVDSGLQGLFLGIETGSPRMQKIINKNLNLEHAVEIVEYMSQKGVKPTISFMYGFPEENEEDLSQTIALVAQFLKLKKITLSPHLCAFFVGTEMSAKYAEFMKPVDYYSNETGNFAVEECKDLIEAYPDLFTHMLEYKTDLRTRLEYFEVFMFVWQLMQPVYQYISEKYPKDRLIDMYYDFAEKNCEFLKQESSLYARRTAQKLIFEDKFVQSFENDENYDLMRDYCRLQQIIIEKRPVMVSEVISFDANNYWKYTSIADLPRGSHMVLCKDGKLAVMNNK